MAASTQQKLAKIFPQSFQVKRLCKQIGDLKDLRQKGSFDIKMTVLRTECLNFKIDILPSAYKNTKLPQSYTKLTQQVKIVVRKNYPAHPPKMFFMNDNMTKYGLRPFRDYFSEFLPVLGDNQWSAKFTITQMVKSLPAFFERCLTEKNITQVFKSPSFQDHFQIDNLFSWKFCQVHPIRLTKKGTFKQGFMFIDISKSQIILLEDVGIQSSYATCDYIRGQQIQSLRKKKNTSNRFLLQIKLNYPGLSGKYGIQFSTQDYEALAIAIMDCARIGQGEKKIPEGESKKQSSSQQQDNLSQNADDQSRKNSLAEEAPTNINQIIEGIVVYQSLVDNKMTSENISQLVSLLQKAIEYYSAHGDDKFQIYLTKLQSILSNQMSQALLESANEQKKKAKKGTQQNKIQKQQYQSIVDLI